MTINCHSLFRHVLQYRMAIAPIHLWTPLVEISVVARLTRTVRTSRVFHVLIFANYLYWSADDPDVIPFHIAGAVDTELTEVTGKDLMDWGLANMRNGSAQEGPYAIRHSRQPVSDFPPRPPRDDEPGVPIAPANFFEKAFPCLFPYGCGGLEAERPVSLSLTEHARWALQFHDRRFRKHETFPFLVFGIMQRRQALTAARLQMNRRDFERDARILHTLSAEKLHAAAGQEEHGVPITDPAVKLLQKHVRAAAGRVMGSDYSRYKIRSQIWSTCIEFGPPYLWITVNPSDDHDPIVQVFAGNEINMDDFIAHAGPGLAKRQHTVADDPYAAAKFFHFIIPTMLRTLFGIEATSQQVHSTPGVFGELTAYIGSVESQGRGTLHLHMMLWLKHAPSTIQISEMLKDESFRQKVRNFMRANLRAYVPGLESKEAAAQIPFDKEVAYCRPPNPNSSSYASDLVDHEQRLARVEQVHSCRPVRCLIKRKDGRTVCKRNAPFPLAEEDTVGEDGSWCPKRLFDKVNCYNPAILINLRCNNDIKLLTNGRETKNITFYVTTYATKKQGRSFNMSAILAEGYAYHQRYPKPEYVDDLREGNRLLLFRLVNTMNREQELAAVMIISYLMGWGDSYMSHMYASIFWSSFVRTLFETFPQLANSER